MSKDEFMMSLNREIKINILIQKTKGQILAIINCFL